MFRDGRLPIELHVKPLDVPSALGGTPPTDGSRTRALLDLRSDVDRVAPQRGDAFAYSVVSLGRR
jgi:hypothetical protein